MSAPAANPPVVHGYPCSVGALLQNLPSEEAAGLEKLLRDPDWSARKVFHAVLDEGHYVGYQSVGKHRRGLCRCATARA